MPVLCIILQLVREGVRALEDKQHTGTAEEAPLLPRTDGRPWGGSFLIATEKKC